MLEKFTSGRVAVYIDAANIFYCLGTLGWRIDFKKLADHLRKETRLVGLSYYTSVLSMDIRQQEFLQKLRGFGYTVVSKEVKQIALSDGGQKLKGSLDVELAIDAALALNSYDTLLLFSGDSDFAPLLDRARTLKKRCIIVSDKGRVSRELIERAGFLNLKKLRPFIERI